MVSAVFTEVSTATELRYRLAAGVQVRAERTGLLFYRRKGPRLYFLSSGKLLSPGLFESGQGLDVYFDQAKLDVSLRATLSAALADLAAKEILVAY